MRTCLRIGSHPSGECKSLPNCLFLFALSVLLSVRIFARREGFPKARAERRPVRSAGFQPALVERASANERCHGELGSILSSHDQSRLETGAPLWSRLRRAGLHHGLHRARSVPVSGTEASVHPQGRPDAGVWWRSTVAVAGTATLREKQIWLAFHPHFARMRPRS